MKHLLLCAILSAVNFAQGQIDPFLGIVPLDQCDFSTPCSYIEIPNTSNNLWQRTESQKSILSHVGPVMITDSVHPYPNDNISSFEIHWPAWNQYPLSLLLSFHHSMDSDSLMDGGIIEVSRDHGATWINVIEDQTNMLFLSNELYTSADTLFNGAKGFSGTFADRFTQIEWIWAFPIKDMPVDTMYYRFRFISDSTDHQKEGWMISDLSFAFVDLGSGINELQAFDFSFSPNPSNGNIELSCPFDIERAVLSDLNGLIISEETTVNKKALNYSGLSKGIYFLQLCTSDGRRSQTKRIVIN
jgi:hypothetical protein